MLELALAAKSFNLNPADLYAIDTQLAEPALVTDFTLVCSLRLLWWDAWVAKKQAEALKEVSEGNRQTQLQLPDGTLVPIPEYQN